MSTRGSSGSASSRRSRRRACGCSARRPRRATSVVATSAASSARTSRATPSERCRWPLGVARGGRGAGASPASPAAPRASWWRIATLTTSCCAAVSHWRRASGCRSQTTSWRCCPRMTGRATTWPRAGRPASSSDTPDAMPSACSRPDRAAWSPASRCRSRACPPHPAGARGERDARLSRGLAVARPKRPSGPRVRSRRLGRSRGSECCPHRLHLAEPPLDRRDVATPHTPVAVSP